MYLVGLRLRMVASGVWVGVVRRWGGSGGRDIIVIVSQMAFPLEQFRDVFTVTAKIKNKLQPFLGKFRELNMEWVMGALEEIHRMFHDDNVDILSKFNSIFALKFIFDSAEVLLVNLIEIYFLPKMLQIAKFDPTGPDDKRGVKYFLSAGYKSEKQELEKYGYNYVRLAAEFVSSAHLVKPRKLYENEELQEPSDYARAYAQLTQVGWKPYDAPAYYKEGAAAAIRAAFLKNLADYADRADPIIDYYLDVFRGELETGKPTQGRLNPRRLLEEGDLLLTSPLIADCEEQFASKSLKKRTHALRLLNEFVRWADIEAAYQINCSELLDATIAQIAAAHVTDRSLNRGRLLFEGLQGNSEQAKQEFYLEFLKSLQCWAVCYPQALKVKNRQSKVKFLYDQLRSNLKLQFPQDSNLPLFKKQFDSYQLSKKLRNSKLLSEFTQLDSDLIPLKPIHDTPKQSIAKVETPNQSIAKAETPRQSIAKAETPKQSIVKAETPKQPSKVEAPKQIIGEEKQQQSSSKIETPSGNDYSKMLKEIKQIKGLLESITENEGKVIEKAKIIKKFREDFDNMLETANVDDKQFDHLLDQSEPLLDSIDQALPHLASYHLKTITFPQLRQLLHPQPDLPQSNQSIRSIIVEKQQNNKEGKKEESTAKKEESVVKKQESSLKQIKQVKQVKQVKSMKQVKQEKQVKQVKSMKQVKQVKEVKQVKKDTGVSQVKKEQIKEATKQVKQPKEVVQVKQKAAQPAPKSTEAITPIKKMQQSFQHQHESFSDSREQSSLPGLSKHSIERSQDSPQHVKHTVTKPKQDIEPASHKNIPKSTTNITKDLKQELSQDKQRNYSHNPYTPDGSKLPHSDSLDPAILPIHSSELKIHKHPKQDIGNHFQELQGEEEHNIQINQPKILKNSMGAYKLRTHPEQGQSARGEKPEEGAGKASELAGKASRVRSRSGSRIDFEESRVVQEQEDLIMMPDSNPLEESFHEDEVKGVKELSFKKCFEADRYLLGADRKQKMFWLANDTLNLVRPSSKRHASGKKDSSYCVPELLQEGERKLQAQLSYVQEQKNRKIKELQEKIKSLQSESLSMKDKIVEQDREIKLIKTSSEVEGSRVKNNNYLEDQNFLFKHKLNSINKSHKDKSFHQTVPTPKCLEPHGTLINSRLYAPYLAQLHPDKKKSLLKNKELLLKDEDIEIGCMAKPEGNSLLVTFYITPQADITLTYSIHQQDSGDGERVWTECEPRSPLFLKGKKQEKVKVSVRVAKVPYLLPEIEFVYNNTDTIVSKRFLIPCAFHKFIHLQPLSQRQLSNFSTPHVLRGEEVPYSKKLLKSLSMLSEYLPNLTLLKDTNEKGEVEFGGAGVWEGQEFSVKIMVKPNQFLYLQAVGEAQPLMEFYIALVTTLLMKNVQLPQI